MYIGNIAISPWVEVLKVCNSEIKAWHIRKFPSNEKVKYWVIFFLITRQGCLLAVEGAKRTCSKAFCIFPHALVLKDALDL